MKEVRTFANIFDFSLINFRDHLVSKRPYFASWGTYRPNWTSRTLYRVPVTRQLTDIDAALIGPLSVTFYLLSNF